MAHNCKPLKRTKCRPALSHRNDSNLNMPGAPVAAGLQDFGSRIGEAVH
jgi:hypothetical protein